MAVLISINGNVAGDGFLLAPKDDVYWADISLATDAGTATVNLQASPNVAGLVFDNPGPHNLTTVPIIVKVHATMQSNSRGDTIIEVLEGATSVANFSVTSIADPIVNFRGRFEARFATAPAVYNQNPKYTAVNELVGPGWTYILEGEPDFTPGGLASIPENLETTGVGRVIRLNNPVSLRSHVPPVVSSIHSITGSTGLGTETFSTGDPIIGLPINFGPDTYFAGNREVTTPGAEEFNGDTVEPIALFQIRIGTPSMYFRGSSAVGPFTAKATMVDQQTRFPDSRPQSAGVTSAAAERTLFGLPSLAVYTDARADLLMADYALLPPGPSTQRRNIVRRINHMLDIMSSAKRTAITTANPGIFTSKANFPPAWTFKQPFTGTVDTDLHAWSNGSSVIEYLRQFFTFDFKWNPFSFHSDELCGHHIGTLQGDPTNTGNSIGDPHLKTVNGVNYDFQAVGEFTLLRGGLRMEVQVRQSPVATNNPITDGYSGLTTCVSLNTAVAAKLGSRRIALQPGKRGSRLQFFVDGKPAEYPVNGLNLDGNRVTTFNADGDTGIRVDYYDNSVLLITPAFWNAYNVSYINVSISNTSASEGIMGHIPKDSWLPRLRNGSNLGPKPASLHDRYVALYKTFADSWRVNDQNSLFIYEPGTSTKTFTDTAWPAEKAPCEMKPEFPGHNIPPFEGMPVDKAKDICKAVTMDDLHANCVFDVATTGDPFFAKGYLIAQEQRLKGTQVRIAGYDTFFQKDRRRDVPHEKRTKTRCA